MFAVWFVSSDLINRLCSYAHLIFLKLRYPSMKAIHKLDHDGGCYGDSSLSYSLQKNKYIGFANLGF